MRPFALTWSLIQQLGRQALNYAVLTILVLVLSPQQFGLVAIASVWIGFLAIGADPGLSVALIQRSSVEPKHLSSSFVANVLLGIALCGAGILLSWPLSLLFKTPEAYPIGMALSLGFLLNSLAYTQLALAQRELRFRDLALRDLTASGIGGAVGVIMAVLGFGAWSLVAQTLVGSATGTLLLWRLSPWRPQLREASMEGIRELWPYSRSIFAYGVFKFFAQNTDKVLIGYLLGPIALGLYSVAWRAVVVPLSTVMAGFGGYLFPRFAHLQDRPRHVAVEYLQFVRLIGVFALAWAIVVFFLSPVLIPLIFGQQWAAAVPVAQILAGVALANSFFGPVGELMKGLGRPDWLLRWSVFLALASAIGVAVGATGGVNGSAMGLLAACTIGFVVSVIIVSRLIQVTPGEITRAIRGPVLAALVLGIFFWLFTPGNQASHPSLALVGVAIGATLFVGTLALVDRALFRDVVSHFTAPETFEAP